MFFFEVSESWWSSLSILASLRVRIGDANNSASDTSASVSSSERELVTAEAEIINASVAHHSASNARVLTVEHKLVLSSVHNSLAVLASIKVAEIAVMVWSGLVIGITVSAVLWVPVRSSGGTSVAEIAYIRYNTH